jgi:hypothetical protein
MRRSLAFTGIIAAGMTVLAVAATPALAAGGPNPNATGTGMCAVTGTAPATSAGVNGGPANGRGGAQGNGRGVSNTLRGQGVNLPASGTLATAQEADLADMVEEEKLAHDVYVTLAANFPSDYQFARIANAESQHTNALRTLLTRYGLSDPSAGEAVGEFSTSGFRSLYSELVGQATTAANALDVGIAVEKLDISDLTSAMEDLASAPDVLQTYTNLRTASQQHLTAFGG